MTAVLEKVGICRITYVLHLGPYGLNWADLDAPVTTCADGTLCCGDYTASALCCATGKGYLIQQGKVINAQDATTSSTSTASRTQSSSPTPQTSSFSPSSTPQTSSFSPTSTSVASVIPTPPPAPKPSNTGVIVGGVVGGVAGVAALALAFWYFMIRQKIKQSKLSQFNEPHDSGRPKLWREEPKEVPAAIVMLELDATQIQREMGDRQSTFP